MRETNEATARNISQEEVRRAIPVVTEGQRERITATSFLQKAGEFGGKLICAAGNVVKAGLSKIAGWFGF